VDIHIEPIGTVHRRCGDEALIELNPGCIDGLHGIEAGDELDILYWMHKLDRGARRVLQAHPRGDASRPLRGVFALRSPMRPNPIGVTRVRVARIEGNRLFVTGLDALDGSPVIDVKVSRR
jgi:tRNA-Thr(GGU) m(6)t(6)A37 methyltransferase TsaA